MTVLLEFLSSKEHLIFNQVCRHIYRVVLPAITFKVSIHAPSVEEEWLEWGKSTKADLVEIKYRTNVKIGKDQGDYCGEWQRILTQDLPNGRGLLNCKDKWILGYAEHRNWRIGSWQVVISKEKNEFKVIRLVIARPGGQMMEFGKVFNEEGHKAAGLFLNDKQVLDCEVNTPETGFMGICGKFTTDHNGFHVGEHNAKNKLHGRGFRLDTSTRKQTNGSLHMGDFENGKQALGIYIHISKGGQIRVGQQYKTASGQTRGKGTMYKVNGTVQDYSY